MAIQTKVWTSICCLFWFSPLTSTQWFPYHQHQQQPMYKMNKPIPLYIPYPFQNNAYNPNVALNSADQYGQEDGMNMVTMNYGGYETTYETTTDSSTTTDSYSTSERPSKFNDYGDQSLLEQIFVIKPANAAVIALMNIVGIIMMAIGGQILIVGKRSIQEDDYGSHFWKFNKDFLNHQVLIEGLKLGSDGMNELCVQRAACEVPNTTHLFTSAIEFLIVLVDMGFHWIPATPAELRSMADALESGAEAGRKEEQCDQMFPCSKLNEFSSRTSSTT